MTFDVAVVGLGAMGSSALYHLAKRGVKAVGFDRHHPPHDLGSSHGRTRVIRQAYYEHPDYVPLVLRAYELWRELEAEARARLLVTTGAYMIGGAVFEGALASAKRHGLRYRIVERVPGLNVRERALFEEEAGVLFVEECVTAHLDRARALGAEIRTGARVAPESLPAKRVIVTAGPWTREFVSLPLVVERQVTYWFRPADTPLFLWERQGRPFYSVPDVRGDGVKLAFHHGGETGAPEDLRRTVSDAEMREMERWAGGTVPGLGAPRSAKVCLYTNTPDGHFAIGLRGPVAVGSACSGHGFKFAPVVGEILADLAVEGRTRHPIGLFSLDRFGRTGT